MFFNSKVMSKYWVLVNAIPVPCENQRKVQPAVGSRARSACNCYLGGLSSNLGTSNPVLPNNDSHKHSR